MEKIKATIKEIEEIYDIEQDHKDTENIPEKENIANATFEEYTVQYDKEDSEKSLKDIKNVWKVEDES